jgi:hypothetical protein
VLEAAVESWLYDGAKPSRLDGGDMGQRLLPLAVRRGRSVLPVDEELEFLRGDLLSMVIAGQHRAEVVSWLASQGWEPADGEEVRTQSEVPEAALPLRR